VSHVDLHLHLLPGVDDGPRDEAASLLHAERLARAGVHEATVTPHIGHPWFPLEVATIPERTRSLQGALDAAGIDLRLHPGGEIYPGNATTLGADELDVIAHGPAGARAGSCSRSRSRASTSPTSPPAPTFASRASGC
jgi:protein-tyrosine phosphatase